MEPIVNQEQDRFMIPSTPEFDPVHVSFMDEEVFAIHQDDETSEDGWSCIILGPDQVDVLERLITAYKERKARLAVA